MTRPSEVYRGYTKAKCLTAIKYFGWKPFAFREVRLNEVYLDPKALWLNRFRGEMYSTVPDGPRIICRMLTPEELAQ